MIRERDNMLDLSPDNARSLKPAADFDAKGFIERDMAIGLQLHSISIKLGIATARYTYLFGEAI